MEKKEIKNEICNYLLEITGLKCEDISSISGDISTIYITTKSNKQFALTITEEETEDREIDYEFEL